VRQRLNVVVGLVFLSTVALSVIALRLPLPVEIVKLIVWLTLITGIVLCVMTLASALVDIGLAVMTLVDWVITHSSKEAQQ
jgi:hypothetical protein